MNLNEQAFLCAALPEPFRVLGCDLRPFSVGHYMLLARLGNRFIVEPESTPADTAAPAATAVPGPTTTASETPAPSEITAHDLFQAVFVCSRPAAAAAGAVRTRTYTRWLRRIERRLRLRRVLVRMGLLPLDAVHMPAIIAAFFAYIAAHSQGPELTPELDDTRREPGTPFVQFVRITLMARLHYTPEAAAEKCWGEALHDIAAYWELEGRTRLVTDADRALWQEHQELLTQLDAQLAELERMYAHGPDE